MFTRRTLNALLTGCSATLFLAPGISHAQTTPGSAIGNPPASTPATQTTTPAPQDGTSDQTSNSGLEDIVVTAQRTGQNLQKVPISISAVTADMASKMGVRGSQDITIAAPAVNFAETSSGANITIRGVGGSGSTVDEPGNAVYIDGIYQASAPGLIFNFNNIERIEVAKGPQGTLFGRNSTGGVIQVITKDPQQKFAVDASVGYGNYRTDTEQLYVTGGLADGLAADLAIYREVSGEGWGKDVVTGRDVYRGRSFLMRSKLKWDVDAGTSVLLSGSYSKIYPATGEGGSILPGETTKAGNGVAGSGYTGFYNIAFDGAVLKRIEQAQGAVTIKHGFGWARLVNIASYSRTGLNNSTDRDYGPAPTVEVDIRFPIRTVTEELQLLSPEQSKITWALGFFYFDNTFEFAPAAYSGRSIGPAFPMTLLLATSNTKSYAGYGQATVPLLTDLRLTIGLRYTSDHQDFTASTTTYLNATTNYAGNKVENKLTKRVALDYQASPNLLLYGSYTTGFHSGLFNLASPATPSVAPENIDAFEAGFKSELFDRKVRFNVSAFHYKFTGIQIRALNSIGNSVLLNAADAKVNGVDVDLTVVPVSGLQINAGLSYLDSHYGSFTNAPFFRVDTANGGLVQFTGDASGKRTVFSPAFVASAGIDYKIGPASIYVTDAYNSGYFFDPQNRVSSGKFNLLNAGIDFKLSNQVTFRVYGRNLANKYYYASITSSTLGDQYFPGAPRTYGFAVRFQY